MRTHPDALARAVFAATLVGPVNSSTATDVLHAVGVGADTTEPYGVVLSDHAGFYPSPSQEMVLEPLYPDRLGEDFIALSTPGVPDTSYGPSFPWAIAASATLLEQMDRLGVRRVLSVLVEASRRWPHLAHNTLYPLLSTSPQLGLAGGSAFLASLASHDHDLSLEPMQRLEGVFPDGRAVDLDSGIAAISLRLAEARLATTDDAAVQAAILDDLSWRMSNAGQVALAVETAEKAITLLRSIRSSGHDDGDVTLAQSLNRLGVCYASIGRLTDALAAAREAVEIWRRIADRDESESQLSRRRSTTWDCGSAMWSPTEGLALCEEAVAIRRTGGEAAEGALASGLTNLGIHLSELRGHGAGLAATTEAVAIYRRLVDAAPGRYEPGLAAALHNLDSDLAGAGRHAEGLVSLDEAISIRRRLAAANPLAFGADLAISLQNRGVRVVQVDPNAKKPRLTPHLMLWRSTSASPSLTPRNSKHP